MLDTSNGMHIECESVENYLGSLVNKFFKILPMREESEPSLKEYLISLQRELIGFGNMVPSIGVDKIYVSILSILQYLISNVHSDECELTTVRSEVFHMISMCNKLKSMYQEGGDCK